MRQVIMVVGLVLALLLPRTTVADALLPKHVTPKTQESIERGLAFLAKGQSNDGSWSTHQDGAQHPASMTALAGMAFLANGNTPSRGPYADNLRRAIRYLLDRQDATGLIAGANNENGRPMYGHGFALLLLSSSYGMEHDERTRQRMHRAIVNAINLTARAQSPMGGWIYQPGGGDEGSVTITQMQALRAAQDAGFTVPNATIDRAIRYLELCKTPEGGIRYSYNSGPQTRLPISAAAITCLYSAGEYDSPLAEACLTYTFGQFKANNHQLNIGGGWPYYAHFYASQAFYQAGDDYWDDYFPKASENLIAQQQADGSWRGDSGIIYGTSIALVILQLPYKFLPIYQR